MAVNSEMLETALAEALLEAGPPSDALIRAVSSASQADPPRPGVFVSRRAAPRWRRARYVGWPRRGRKSDSCPCPWIATWRSS